MSNSGSVSVPGGNCWLMTCGLLHTRVVSGRKPVRNDVRVIGNDEENVRAPGLGDRLHGNIGHPGQRKQQSQPTSTGSAIHGRD
jgi:hypothetical protein